MPYAAHLNETVQNVSLLARGQLLDDLRKHEILIEDPIVGESTTTYVNVVDLLAPEDAYNLIMVFVRKNQLSESFMGTCLRKCGCAAIHKWVE